MGHSVYLVVKPLTEQAHEIINKFDPFRLWDKEDEQYRVETIFNWPWQWVHSLIHSGLTYQQQLDTLKHLIDKNKKEKMFDKTKVKFIRENYLPFLTSNFESYFDWE